MEYDPEWREEQASSLSAVQEQLAAMPGQLSAVEDQFKEVQRTTKATAVAEKAAAGATGDSRAAIERAADAARQVEYENRSKLKDAGTPINPAIAEEMSSDLAKFTPDSDAIRRRR